MTTAIVEVQKADVEQGLLAKINGIHIIAVVDSATFEQAAENVKAMTEAKKAWTGYWSGIKDAAHKTWKGIVEKEKGPLDALEKRALEQKASAKVWADAEEAKRREAERKAQEAARKQAEDEAIAAAAALEAAGNKAAAEEIIQAPVPVAQVVVPTTVPKGYGGMTQKYYSATVTDIKALARAVLEGKVPAQAIQGNEVWLNGQARQLKETMAYPGVTVNVR